MESDPGQETEATRPEPTAATMIEVKNLVVNYGKFEAVKGISFAVEQGEVFGFIGPNGAGKTSTIKVLATLLKPTSGTVKLAGVNVATRPYRARPRFGYAPDFFGVYEDLTTLQYMHFFAAAYRIPRRQAESTIRDLLELTDLQEKADAQVDSLSRGMKQRLSLARVLVHDPDVLLLDEPASGLDPRARIEIRELLKELTRMGKTILISSHILQELGQFCTSIGIIEAGEMVAQGSLDEIYKVLELKRSVHVQLSNGTPELLRRIGNTPGVEAVIEEKDRLAISIREDELAVEDLLDAIHSLGGRIRMFQPEAMDMETVFMKLTEGKTA